MGELAPNGSAWRILTAIGSLNGFLLITLSFTYLLPVVSATVQMQQIAEMIDSLGDTPQAIVVNAWTGRDFEGLGDQLLQLSSLIEVHAQRHLAYPVLHYIYGSERHTAFTQCVEQLHEDLFISSEGLAPELRLAPVDIRSALQSIESSMRLGIGTVSQQEFKLDVARYDNQRRTQYQFVREAGVDWTAVSGEQTDPMQHDGG